MERDKLAKEIYRASHLTGEFLLRSGQISQEYFDKYMFTSDPVLLDAITEGLAELLPEKAEIIAGLEMGAIPLAAALSLRTGVPAAFVRKKAKEYGTRKIAEGADVRGKRVCVVEDVVTTGGQILLSVRDLRERGAEVDNVLCVIQRSEQAAELLAAEGLNLIPLYTMEYIKSVAE